MEDKPDAQGGNEPQLYVVSAIARSPGNYQQVVCRYYWVTDTNDLTVAINGFAGEAHMAGDELTSFFVIHILDAVRKKLNP